jgi:septum site-determining protein MinD
MGKVFVITSGKGGVGKTTTAINLAAALNSFKENALVVDANLTTPNIGIYLGAPVVPIGLSHVLAGKADLNDAIYEHESGTKVVPSSLSIKELEKIKPEKLSDVSKKLRKLADWIILDSSAGLGNEALAAMAAGDEIIIVTNPEIASVTDALKTARIAENLGKSVGGVIVTRVKKDGLDMPYLNVKDMLELPIIGIIPEDKSVRHSHVLKDAVVHTHPRSKAARAYKEIAARLIGREYVKEEFWHEKILRKLGLG